MNDAVPVSIIEGATRLDQVSHSLRQPERGTPRDELLQALALQVFHGDEGSTALLSHFIYGDHVGVLQTPGGLSFSIEALQQVSVVGEPSSDRLQRHEPADARVARLENHTHGTAA